MIGRKVTNDPARRIRECYFYNQGIRPDDPGVDLDDLPLGRIATHDWSNCRILDRMLMYERRIENSVVKLMKELKRFQVIRQIELHDAEQEFEPSLREEDATRSTPAEKKVDLKKQSQFAANQIDASSFAKGNYGNKSAGGDGENKANQSQFPGSELSKGAGKTGQSVGEANSLTG